VGWETVNLEDFLPEGAPALKIKPKIPRGWTCSRFNVQSLRLKTCPGSQGCKQFRLEEERFLASPDCVKTLLFTRVILGLVTIQARKVCRSGLRFHSWLRSIHQERVGGV